MQTNLSKEEIDELRDKAAIYDAWQNEYKNIDKFLKDALEDEFPYSEGSASVTTLKAVKLYAEKIASERLYRFKTKKGAKYANM